MRFVRHLAPLAIVYALVVTGCSEGVQIPDPGDGGQACKSITDCPTGQGCLQGVCAELPCGGRCTSDESCVRNKCMPIDGLACADDPSVCPRGFVCAATGECQRSCTVDRDCTAPGFNSCNVETGLCGECTFNQDCSGPTPVCDTRTSRCVGCVENSDCGGAGRICDPVSQVCDTGCTKAEECGPGLRCLGATASAPGRCVECEVATEQSDCTKPGVERCNPQTLRCVPCVENADCMSNQCNTRASECVECIENEYCERGFTCDLDAFKCFEGCGGANGGPNCPPEKPACDRAKGPRGTCVECMQDGDCGWGKVCQKNGNYCVEGCRAGTTGAANDGRCANPPAGKEGLVVCDAGLGGYGQCVECLTDAQCAPTQRCDGALKVCRKKVLGESCTATSDCGCRPGQSAFDCTPTKVLCVKEVQCGSNWRTVANPVCGVASSANSNDPCSPSQGPNFTTRNARGEPGTSSRQCVPIALCQ